MHVDEVLDQKHLTLCTCIAPLDRWAFMFKELLRYLSEGKQ